MQVPLEVAFHNIKSTKRAEGLFAPQPLIPPHHALRIGKRRTPFSEWPWAGGERQIPFLQTACDTIHRTATMNSRGKRSSTFPSNRGL